MHKRSVLYYTNRARIKSDADGVSQGQRANFSGPCHVCNVIDKSGGCLETRDMCRNMIEASFLPSRAGHGWHVSTVFVLGAC